MHLVMSPSHHSPFSPQHQHQRMYTSSSHRPCSSTSSTSSSSGSPFTSPSRPTPAPASSGRRQLDFGGGSSSSPPRSSPEGGKMMGVGGRKEEEQEEQEAMCSSFEDRISFQSSSSSMNRSNPFSTQPTTTASSSYAQAQPAPTAPKSPTPTSRTSSPRPPSSSFDLLPRPTSKPPPLLRRSPFSIPPPPPSPNNPTTTSCTLDPTSFIPSYSQRSYSHDDQPASSSSTTSPFPHQQIQRLRPSSVSLHSSSPKPSQSPTMLATTSSPTNSIENSNGFDFDQARPSPEAFKVSLMKKSSSGSSFGSQGGPGSARKGLVVSFILLFLACCLLSVWVPRRRLVWFLRTRMLFLFLPVFYSSSS
ncbi:hypothetical protein BDY24DRAFT_190871 [Mrakia frigida]|uniref:uncharacterized protein n=1 Tax=Mrakia frigida TaxID=29902 RepID=UPI003FCC18EE